MDQIEAQIGTELKETESSHRTFLVAGWRPMVGWVCVTALVYGWVIAPVLRIFINTVPEVPVIKDPMALVVVLLGSSAARTYEKFKGVSK